MHVYTDGSFEADSNTSSWAVTIADEWFDASIATIPSDEKQLQPMHVRGATMLGASISCTQGVYPAELQAIARVLAMFPLSCPLHVHSDSESSLSAIRSFLVQCNERRRLRMAGRPLLQLIHHLLDSPSRRHNAESRQGSHRRRRCSQRRQPSERLSGQHLASSS